MKVQLNPKVVLAVLLGCLGLVTVLHIVSWIPVMLKQQDYAIIYFDVTEERNIPTLFSTCLLLLNAVLTLLIAFSERTVKGRFLFWLVLSVAFLWMGIDETIMIHEYISDHLHARFNTSGVFRFAWVIPYGIAVLVLFAFFFRSFLGLPADTKKWLALSGFIYLFGAVGMEMVGSAWFDARGFDAVYNVINSFEELLEMLGCIFLVYTFMRYISREHPDLSVGFSSVSE